MINFLIILFPALIILLFLSLIGFLLFILASAFYSDFVGAPYIQNDDKVIKESLKLANVSKKTKLIDLGSGNGKVLRMAEKDFKTTNTLGYELAPWPYFLSKLHKTKTIRKSIFDADLDDCDVVYVYLLPKLLKKLSDKFAKLKIQNPKVKIVSPVFKIEGLIPKKVIDCYHKGFKKMVSIYLY